ncbi:uracil-DNA glycosylase [Candidatus Pelagibacter sp.]|uniref:uracil-DNA glycosylase n=1 Tax=Candidatus Pelagibacter sp. TaxID=2024849 RepID=UPI003F82E91F
MDIKFKKLNKTIIKCKRCPRLNKFINKIAQEKRPQNINEKYWGKPVAGFGKENAKLMILGLAPAAHGGTRTGRAFTGDKSGDVLFDCLYSVKISNQNFSTHLHDGLNLNKTYVTNVLKCVPPEDKPKIDELKNCSNYFNSEINYLKNLKVIVALGKIAFDNCVKIYKSRYGLNSKFLFIHGKEYLLPDNKILIACYHPSPRNINTKVVTKKMICSLFLKAKKIARF